MSRNRTSASCHARAAIAGNPSDLHGGAVLAAPVRSVWATVAVEPAPSFEIDGFPTTPPSLDRLEHDAARRGFGRDQPLVAATLIALRRALSVDVDPLRIDVVTSIPRGVGLGGSSAIVLATARALIEHHRHAPWAVTLDRDPELLASLALEAETSVLGIAAGPQDRLVQALDDNVFMDFAHWTPGFRGGRARWRRLGRLPGHWFVACRPDHATESHLSATMSPSVCVAV